MMNFSEDEKKMIMNFGALNYPLSKIASLLRRDKEALKLEIQEENSLFNQIWQQGLDYAEYLVHIKIMDMAQAGDLRAIAKFEKIREDNE